MMIFLDRDISYAPFFAFMEPVISGNGAKAFG